MNLRPLGPQPSALPSYAIPREQKLLYQKPEKKQPENIVRNIQKRKRTRRFRRSFQFFIKKNGPWHILAPRAVACDNLHLRASAHHWHVSAWQNSSVSKSQFFSVLKYLLQPLQQPFLIILPDHHRCPSPHILRRISHRRAEPCRTHHGKIALAVTEGRCLFR